MTPHRRSPLWVAVCVTWLGCAGGEPDGSDGLPAVDTGGAVSGDGTWMGEPLSVYVLPKRTLGDATEFVRRFRHNTVMWSQNDRTYIIVTPWPRDPALDSVVAYVRARAY